jgi:hypothetical protein
MNICFLLGSGISNPAELPSVQDITTQVLSPKDYFRDSDEIYRKIASENQRSPILVKMQMPEMERIEQFLRWLKAQAELRYARDSARSVNYEDLAYLAAQIRDDLSDEYENPALGPLICCALNTLPGLCAHAGEECTKLGHLAEESVNFIDDVVAEMLCKPPARKDHLQLFLDAVNDERFDEVNLFTLNHDTLLERFLQKNGVDVVDGFDQEDSLGIRRWNPRLFDCCRTHTARPTVRLYKLHGSINWRRFRPREPHKAPLNPWLEEYVGIRSNADLSQERDEQGRTHEELMRARFLTGTFNKMLNYLDDVFLELHYRFHRTLDESDRLVVCGYGLGDKGINKRIIDWMVLSPESARRKMVLIDPRSFEQVQESSRGAIGDKLSILNVEGRLDYFQLRVGSPDLTWETIATSLLAR